MPITKDGPLTLPETAVLATDPPQPAASNEAAARERRASKGLPRYRDDNVDIGAIAFCEVRSLSGTNAELAVGPLPTNAMMQPSLGALVCGVIAGITMIGRLGDSSALSPSAHMDTGRDA